MQPAETMVEDLEVGRCHWRAGCTSSAALPGHLAGAPRSGRPRGPRASGASPAAARERGPMAAAAPGAGHMREREARLAQAMRERSSGWAQTRE